MGNVKENIKLGSFCACNIECKTLLSALLLELQDMGGVRGGHDGYELPGLVLHPIIVFELEPVNVAPFALARRCSKLDLPLLEGCFESAL
ncbi:hypothetical protein EVAR_17576_1 [Eumeta japonica]|uniref:Uncharacterized protein n=1 Tax=Eumeta variegata TaxID=151549 RepID=A0A4C1UC67_EUMVA|nr:hypothetical protein EVAR_17576_1 [Eumeta japonica]